MSVGLEGRKELNAHPTWNKTFGPMQKKQSTILNANTMGILLMYLEEF
jgi:hypothetical protein